MNGHDDCQLWPDCKCGGHCECDKLPADPTFGIGTWIIIAAATFGAGYGLAWLFMKATEAV